MEWRNRPPRQCRQAIPSNRQLARQAPLVTQDMNEWTNELFKDIAGACEEACLAGHDPSMVSAALLAAAFLSVEAMLGPKKARDLAVLSASRISDNTAPAGQA